MPRPSRKKQKTALIKRSCTSAVLAEPENPQEQTNTAELKLVLFGKSITMDEHNQRASYYAKLRYWFQHAIPESSGDIPHMNYISSTSASASPSTSRHTLQEADVPLKDDSYTFQKIPPPLVTNIPPYPIMVPLKKTGLPLLPKAVTGDIKKLLEHNKAHWKMVRRNWILHRQLYLQRYKPCFEFINSTYAPPMEE